MTYVKRQYCEICKKMATKTTRVESCAVAKKYIYCRTCTTKMVVQKTKCPFYPCHKETTEKEIQPCFEAQKNEVKQQEKSHDTSKDGKNRVELGGNDTSYKHRLVQDQDQNQQQNQNQQENQYQRQNRAQDYLSPFELNTCVLYSKYKFKQHSELKTYLVNKTKEKKYYYLLVEILEVLKETIRLEELYDQKKIVISWRYSVCTSTFTFAFAPKPLPIKSKPVPKIILKKNKWTYGQTD